MQKFIFRYPLKGLLFMLILACCVTISNQTYCSAFCSYERVGAFYYPRCIDETAAKCIKCDKYFFELNGTVCQPHGNFNETVYVTELLPPLGLTIDWLNATGDARVNVRSGVYSLLEFYYDSSPLAGGDDTVYKTYMNLPAHYSIRARFFVLRSATSTMTFNYYLDTHKFTYNYNSYPSSQSLGDIITTDKIFHQNSELTVTFEVIFSGMDEFIGVKELILFIGKCSNFCLFCDSSANCVKCAISPLTGNYTFLYKGQCYEQCPETTFGNVTSKLCQPCLPECQNCVASPSDCVQCKSEGRFQSFLYNKTCYYDCPNGLTQDFVNNTCICPMDGFWLDNSTHLCLACAPQCKSCHGGTLLHCIECSIGYYLVERTSVCARQCPSNQYGDQLAAKCFGCSSICSQCQNSSNQCTACFFATSVRYLHNEQCLVECPRGYGRNLLMRRCDKCMPFYYSHNGECVVQCPDQYVANNESKSCLHITETDFILAPRVSKYDVQPVSKRITFELSFSQGLNEGSKNWFYSQGYYKITIKGGSTFFNVSTLTVENDYVVKVSFIMSEIIDQEDTLTINFGVVLNTSSPFKYSSKSASFSLSDYPQYLQSYYEKANKSYYSIVMLPIFLIMFVLIALRLRATYDLLIQTVRMFQLIGLSIFITYPVQNQLYSFLMGMSYFNFEFLPNIYNIFVPAFQNSMENKLFLGFKFLYGDMDFIRMIGSILLLIALLILVIIVLKLFVTENTTLLGWLIKVGMDVVEIKIIHSFWNSLIFTIMNSTQDNLYIFWVHLFSYTFIGLVGFRYYKTYQSTGEINYSFLWRLLSTLLLSISVFNKMIVFIILTLLSIGFGIKQLYTLREISKDAENFKFGFAFKIRYYTISLLSWLSIMAICMIIFYKHQMKSIAVIGTLSAFTYVLITVEIITIIFLTYFYKKRQKTNENRDHKNGNQDQMYSEVDHQSTISNASEFLKTENQKQTYLKDQFGVDLQNTCHEPVIKEEEKQQDFSEEKKEDEHENESRVRSTFEKSLVNTMNTREVEIKQDFKESKISKKSQLHDRLKFEFPHQSDDQSYPEPNDHRDQRVKRGNRTQVLKRKQVKVDPLRTLTKEDEEKEEAQFEKITLEKNSNRPNRSRKLLSQRPNTSAVGNIFMPDQN